VANESGALSRIAGLFSARGYNIESLTVAATEDPSLSRMTIVTRGTDKIIEQIVKQLNKLIEVVSLIDMYQDDHIERELMLLKIEIANQEQLSGVKQLVDIFRGRILDVTGAAYVVELTGTSRKMNSFINALDKSKILEVVRTGVSGITRD
jgi:acetolactate synthase-1/3 small subunit